MHMHKLTNRLDLLLYEAKICHSSLCSWLINILSPSRYLPGKCTNTQDLTHMHRCCCFMVQLVRIAIYTMHFINAKCMFSVCTFLRCISAIKILFIKPRFINQCLVLFMTIHYCCLATFNIYLWFVWFLTCDCSMFFCYFCVLCSKHSLFLLYVLQISPPTHDNKQHRSSYNPLVLKLLSGQLPLIKLSLIMITGDKCSVMTV